MLVLSDNEISSLLDMKEAIEVVEEAFLELEEGVAKQPKRIVIEIHEKKGAVLLMPAYLPKEEVISTKLITVYGENIMKGLPTSHSVILLCDPDTGMIECLMNGNFITAMRTGAASGVATKYLARKDAKVCGIIGAGAQAWTQLWAVLEMAKIDKVKVYDIVRERALDFAERAREKFNVEVDAVKNAKEACENVDILITATTSKTPVLKGEWLKEGTHINSIGWMGRDGRELDSETVSISKIVVDKIDAALSEIGDFLIPISEGKISRDHIYAEIGEVIAGKKAGRVNDREITLWKSLGQAIQDAAVAKLAYLKAKEKGVGKQIEI